MFPYESVPGELNYRQTLKPGEDETVFKSKRNVTDYQILVHRGITTLITTVINL